MHLFEWDDLMRDLVVVLGIVLLVYVSLNITPITFETIASGQAAGDINAYIQGKVPLSALVAHYLVPMKEIFTVISMVFLAGIIWIVLRGIAVHHKEHEQFAPIPVAEAAAKALAVEWQVILDHVNSENPAEWKLAILEADNMLDELLEEQGYFGESVADKLKAMSPSRISSYEGLWEAHKLRNQIAHGGAIDMDLSKKIARDAIAKFESAFRDLGYL